jgi:hypothetical protein
MWHVKGNLFLTGYEWSSNYLMDDCGHPSGYAYYFDFNEGKPNDEETGYSTFKHALCVRGMSTGSYGFWGTTPRAVTWQWRARSVRWLPGCGLRRRWWWPRTIR